MPAGIAPVAALGIELLRDEATEWPLCGEQTVGKTDELFHSAIKWCLVLGTPNRRGYSNPYSRDAGSPRERPEVAPRGDSSKISLVLQSPSSLERPHGVDSGSRPCD
jgi:hypothetical protein